MAKHTPGPWTVIERGNTYHRLVVNAGLHGKVCELAARPERDGNASLIAAAPDLLDGCNGLLGLLTLISARPDCPPEIANALQASHRIDEAEAAIAKATAA